MKTIGTYSFLPWIRHGIGNIIQAADLDQTVKTRASVGVTLTLTGQAVGGGAPLAQALTQNIALHGPGDVKQLQALTVVRTEPRDWTTNFESNYLAAVDFYDEDAPWRFTPAAANGTKLRPWLTLVVLAEDEFKDGKRAGAGSVPFISVADTSVFPPAADLWAWAHVHFNGSLSSDPTNMVVPDMSAVLPLVQALISQNPDVAYSRLICPRRLKEKTSYHAFVIPTFETGRLAALGEKVEASPYATMSAWESYSGKAQAQNFPYYFRWYFRTANLGDFEYLVRLLTPQPADPRVGVRDMDVQFPGSNVPGILDAALHGILPLGGALQVPDADLDPPSLQRRQQYELWDQPYPHPFQSKLAKFINLPDDYSRAAATTANAATAIGTGVSDSKDPLITAPLYGCWHALTRRLLYDPTGATVPNSTNWVHRLNLDPRFRVPAGFGANVVETNAEAYVNAAWEQVGDVLAANARLRRWKLSMEVSLSWYRRTLQPLAAATPERALAITAPVSSRVLLDGKTVAFARMTSLLPPVYTSTAMRRVVRPGSRLIRSLPFDAAATPNHLLARVNSGQATAAPPKVVPPGVVTVNQVAAAAAAPKNVPPGLLALLQAHPWIPSGPGQK